MFAAELSKFWQPGNGVVALDNNNGHFVTGVDDNSKTMASQRVPLLVLVLQLLFWQAHPKLKTPISKAESDALIQSRCATYGTGVCMGRRTSRHQDAAECEERLSGVKEKINICNHTYVFIRGQMHGGTGVARKVIAQFLKRASVLTDARLVLASLSFSVCVT